MATLEHKRRVRLPEDFFLDQASMTRRPWPRWPLLACGWLAFTGLCFAITTDRVPLGQWLASALEPTAEAKPPGTPPPPAPPAVTPLPGPTTPRAETRPEEPVEAPRLAPGTGDSTEDPPSPDLAALTQPPESDQAGRDPAPARPLPAPAEADDSEPPPRAEVPSPPPVEASRPAPATQSSVGASCEAAIANYQEEIRIGGASAPPDLSRAQFAAVLENGRYFAHCGAPDSMSVEICAAVRNGRAVGVTVRTAPGSAAVQSCVARAVRGLGFPSHPRMDVTRTRFAPTH